MLTTAEVMLGVFLTVEDHSLSHPIATSASGRKTSYTEKLRGPQGAASTDDLPRCLWELSCDRDVTSSVQGGPDVNSLEKLTLVALPMLPVPVPQPTQRPSQNLGLRSLSCAHFSLMHTSASKGMSWLQAVSLP